MAKDETDLSADVKAMMSQRVEQARGAVDNYLQFIQSSMSASPWTETDLNKKLGLYAERNVAIAFAYVQKLIQARTVQDLVRIQTEFVQTQIQALSEQTKELADTATQATVSAFKGQTKPPA